MPRGEPRSREPWEEPLHCDSSEHGAPGEGEKRGKMRFRNTEERFLEPNSLKSSVWLAAGKHFYIWVSLEALQISVVCSSRVYNFVQFASDSSVSWMPRSRQDGETLAFIPQRLAEHLLCVGRAALGAGEGEPRAARTPPGPSRDCLLLGSRQ